MEGKQKYHPDLTIQVSYPRLVNLLSLSLAAPVHPDCAYLLLLVIGAV